MRTGDAPEIIEILDDDGSAFDQRRTAATQADGGGPRWIAPAAVAALVAIIGYGIVTSTSSSRSPDAAPSTTTTPSPSTTRPPATTVVPATAAPQVQHFAADVPADLQLVSAEDVSYWGGSDPTLYQLWATPGSSSTSGKWFSIHAFVDQGTDMYAPDSYRLATADGVIAISRAADGSIAASTIQSSTLVMIRGYGLSGDELIAIAEGTSAAKRVPRRLDIDPALTAGYTLLSEVEPWTVVAGNPNTQVSYQSNEGLRNVMMLVSPHGSVHTGLTQFPDRRTALAFMLDQATAFSVPGGTAVAGRMAESHDMAVAAWTAGGYDILMTGQIPVSDLISIAASVHEVTADRWLTMRADAQLHSNDMQYEYTEGQPVPVSFGTDGNGDAWTIQAANGTWGTVHYVNWMWDDQGYGFTSTVTDSPAIHTLALNDRVYVMAELPRNVAAGAELHVTRQGADAVTIPFNDIDPTLDRTLAAYALSEPVPFSAQIVSPDGAVLATWPAS